MRANTILETIGHTPHVRLQRLFPEHVEVWLKLERANPVEASRTGLRSP